MFKNIKFGKNKDNCDDSKTSGEKAQSEKAEDSQPKAEDSKKKKKKRKEAAEQEEDEVDSSNKRDVSAVSGGFDTGHKKHNRNKLDEHKTTDFQVHYS